jgi:hypothetical protein
LGHKHLRPGNRVAQKEGLLIGRFLESCGETYVLNIQFGVWPPILQGDYITKYISFGDINISFRDIELCKKKGSYSYNVLLYHGPSLSTYTAKKNSDAILIKLEELAASEFIKEAYGILRI